mgnify:CR=1 FL=1|tara:strand:+ start:1575 stop:1691 length:117 start_codon:yes stop_codon:yes gene_type:complete
MDVLDMTEITEFTIEDDADIDAIRAKLKEILKHIEAAR